MYISCRWSMFGLPVDDTLSSSNKVSHLPAVQVNPPLPPPNLSSVVGSTFCPLCEVPDLDDPEIWQRQGSPQSFSPLTSERAKQGSSWLDGQTCPVLGVQYRMALPRRARPVNSTLEEHAEHHRDTLLLSPRLRLTDRGVPTQLRNHPRSKCPRFPPPFQPGFHSFTS